MEEMTKVNNVTDRLNIPTSAHLVFLPADTVHFNNFNSLTPARLTYFPPPNPLSTAIARKATGIDAVLTFQTLSDSTLGSAAYSPATPPGWAAVQADGGNPNRGHLQGDQLGGSGRDVRNIVTMYRDCNHPGMTYYENKVKRTFQQYAIGDCQVYYQVLAQYRDPTKDFPTNILMRADIFNPFDSKVNPWFLVDIPNDKNAQNNKLVHYDDQNIMVKCTPTPTPNPQAGVPTSLTCAGAALILFGMRNNCN